MDPKSIYREWAVHRHEVPSWGSLLLIDVYVSTEKEVCLEHVKERCSDRKTGRKLGIMVND